MAIVLDTHAWLWWVARDGRVSRRASTVIRRAQANETLWLSLISTWEVAKKVERGQLALDRPLDEWLAVALATPGLQVAELTRSILIDSCRLPQPFHGDPADQMIVATARAQNAAIVTRDARIREYAHVRTIW
jgi:PIN domain nuclease of toxin-antitoxin system